jgi:hypothetical protein
MTTLLMDAGCRNVRRSPAGNIPGQGSRKLPSGGIVCSFRELVRPGPRVRYPACQSGQAPMAGYDCAVQSFVDAWVVGARG